MSAAVPSSCIGLCGGEEKAQDEGGVIFSVNQEREGQKKEGGEEK